MKGIESYNPGLNTVIASSRESSNTGILFTLRYVSRLRATVSKSGRFEEFVAE